MGSVNVDDAGNGGEQVPFIGREDELELLRMLLARAVREASPQLVTVMGEPGVGKSRMVAAFSAELSEGESHRASAPRTARGVSLPPGEGSPLGALSEIVRSLAGARPGQPDTAEDFGRALERELQEVLSDPSERDWFLARLAPLLGGDGAEVGGTTEGESFAAWRRFLEAEAARAPLVLTFEDLHHAGDRLLAFLEHVLDWSTAAPVLILCTARPELYERRPGWGGGKRSSTTIALSPLPKPDTEALVRSLFDALPAGTRAAAASDAVSMVVERSSGNPLYAEQFVRLLADRGVADPAGDMPDTIRALIAARLAGLSPAQHAVLLDAAVLGPVFWPDALANMNGPDHELVITSLRELARKELVRPSRSSSLGDRQEYAFVHGLVRDVAYEEIPAASRWQKHRAAASWLEGAGAQDVPAFAEALAHHYAEAARLGRELGEDATTMEPIEERAVRFLLRAGDAATQVDVRRAEALYRQALPMCPAGDPDRAVLLARIGDMAALTGDYNEAATLLEDATAAFLGEGKRLEAARATLDLAYATFRQAGTSREHQALDRAFELLEGLPPGREHARAATDRAAELFFVGDSRGALAATDGALQLANEVGAQDLAARLLEIRGMSRCDLGDQGGLADLHRALAGSNELGLGPEAVRAYLNLGTFATPVEGPAAALAYFTAGATLAQRRGITELGMWTKAWELGVLFELGEWDRLLAEGREVLLWDRARGGSQLGIAAQNCMAEVLAYRDRTAEAAEMANEFVGEARAIGDPQILLPALVIAAVARSEHGDPDGAVQAVEEFAQIYPDRARWVGSLFLQVCVRVCIAVGRPDLAERLAGEPDETTRRGRHVAESARGEVAEAHGRVEDALVHHRAAAEGWASYGFPFEHAHASMGAARCLVRLGRPDEAASPADDAAGTFEGLGAMPLAGRARAIV